MYSEVILNTLMQHGFNAVSFQTMQPGFLYFQDSMGGFVAYVDTGTAYVAAGAPVGQLEHLSHATQEFEQFAHSVQKRVCYFAVENRFLQHYDGKAICLGEQPVFHPYQWVLSSGQAKDLHRQLRRARQKGVVVRELDADILESSFSPERQQIEVILEEWKQARKAALFSFLLSLHPFLFLKQRLCFVAEHQSHIVAFLILSPVYTRSGWLIEHFIKASWAPNGTMELLIDTAIRCLAQRSVDYITLGMAPLSDSAFRPLKLAKIGFNFLYNFNGLYQFKAKFAPTGWDKLFLAYPRKQHWPSALYDTLAAFSAQRPFSFLTQSMHKRFR